MVFTAFGHPYITGKPRDLLAEIFWRHFLSYITVSSAVFILFWYVGESLWLCTGITLFFHQVIMGARMECYISLIYKSIYEPNQQMQLYLFNIYH